MKKNYLFVLWVAVSTLCCCTALQAQYRYTPPPPPIHFQPYNFYSGSSTTISQKHHFKIVFADGRDTTVYTRIIADSPAQYLMVENKSVGKKDSARHLKIFPSATKYISHLDVLSGGDFVGQASDSCWLFKVIGGKINAYTEMAESSVTDDCIRYIQLGDGPMLSIKDPKAAELFAGDARAQELFADKKYNRAIKRYNR